MIILKNSVFWDYNFKFYIMIDMHLKYDKMHKNIMIYALVYINNHIITSINNMLSIVPHNILWFIITS